MMLIKSNLIFVLSLGAFLSGVLSIFFHYKGKRNLVYLFKPLTMAFIIAIALTQSFPSQTHYSRAIILGLVFSLAGDIFLINHKRFIHGLVSFLIAHLFYIAAFVFFVYGDWHFTSALPVLISLILMLSLLWNNLGKLKIPVLVYMLVIALMGWQSINRWFVIGDVKSMLAAFGALLFMASDSILAINKFRYSFRAAHIFLLMTYFIAQWLIALSV